MKKPKNKRKKPIDLSSNGLAPLDEKHHESFLSKLKKRYEEAGLNFKKEAISSLVMAFIIIAMSVLMGIMYSSPYAMAGGILAGIVYLYVSYDKPSRIIGKRKEHLRGEFVSLFAFYRLFISNGRSVYSSFEETRRYASREMLPHLERLLREIDIDKSVAPYLHFAGAFDSLAIRQTMVAIYDLSLDGGQERLSHFEALFARLRVEGSETSFNRYKKRLDNLNLLPMVSGGFSMVLVALAVIAIMGSVGYGL